ncbi:hypothetical protein QJS04_geneDACA011575 [Acorus gramineus]|uniref:Uncharacterized protein n=1 Tax=Acorus gramineus TaxID=55184 RepID=A0AAV9AF06_ACOGR|nr:hypothetical protein QJS04_geneDACA011575 [Acorus gramineus]
MKGIRERMERLMGQRLSFRSMQDLWEAAKRMKKKDDRSVTAPSSYSLSRLSLGHLESEEQEIQKKQSKGDLNMSRRDLVLKFFNQIIS